jgi:hypothetical protein
MELISDSYFEIGSSHEVCQDYALDHKGSGSALAILGDGCSSNHHSDFGSRIITRLAEKQIQSCSEIMSPQELIFKSKFLMDQLNLEPSHLNSTLMAVSAYSEFKVQTFGDGVIVARERDTQDLFVIDVEYPSGAPFYLQYLLDEDLLEGWKERFSPKVNVHTSYIRKETGAHEPIMDLEVDEGLPNFMYEETFDFESYDLVAVLSDGIHSFQETEYPLVPYGSKRTSDLGYIEIIKELFDFKQMNGVFLRRRCNKFFKNCKKKNRNHYDDFSVAAVYCGDSEKDSE